MSRSDFMIRHWSGCPTDCASSHLISSTCRAVCLILLWVCVDGCELPLAHELQKFLLVFPVLGALFVGISVDSVL